MSSAELLIQHREKLTNFFDGWPSFHDAEVVELHFWRSNIQSGDWDDRNIFPVLTIKVIVLEATQPTAVHAGHNVLVTLRFHDVDDFKMEGFNHQNAILGFSLSAQARGKFGSGEDLPPYLIVQFEPAFGMGASFRCFRIEVVDAVLHTDANNGFGSEESI